MYYSTEALEKDLTAQGYHKIERKPWNVRKDDILVFEQWGMGFLNSGFMPTIVTMSDSYPEFHNPYPYDHSSLSRTTYRHYYKPFSEHDANKLPSHRSMSFYSTDSVEVWRKRTPRTKK